MGQMDLLKAPTTPVANNLEKQEQENGTHGNFKHIQLGTSHDYSQKEVGRVQLSIVSITQVMPV